jgi:hypothetical protein
MASVPCSFRIPTRPSAHRASRRPDLCYLMRMLWLIAFFLIAGWLAWSFYRRRCPRCGSFATGQFEYEWSCDNCHHIW